MADLTAVSLFAGVEGFGLALERSGVTVSAAVEKDDAARGVIADRMPNTTLFTDVTEVTADELRAAGFVPERGILTAGWPCQGNSIAGGRKGLADPRSGLWAHVVRLLDELRPAWFLGENVPGLLSVTGGEDFGRVLQDLADLGYGFAYRVLGRDRPSSGQEETRVAATLTAGTSRPGVSAPGRRQEDDSNLVAVSVAENQRGEVVTADVMQSLSVGGGKPGQGYPLVAISAPSAVNALTATGVGMVLAVATAVMGDRAHTLTAEGADASEDGTGRGTPVVAIDLRNAARESGNGAGTQGDGWKVDGPSYTLSATHRALPGVTVETGVRRLTPLECERLQGYPDNWTATSWGKPQADSPRYRQMGNSVAVPCVEWIVRRMVQVDQGNLRYPPGTSTGGDR